MTDIRSRLDASRQAALLAGRMLRERFGKPAEIEYKGEVNLVTESDHLSQKMIFEHLSGLFPGDDFLAEEDLRREGGAACRWIIDPLDGTTNFSHQFPVFCVSIGLEVEGRAETGVVYDPMREEMFWAVRGQGARLNDRPVRVSTVSEVGRALLATGFPYDIRSSRDNIGHFSRFLVRAQAIRRCGAAALDLCYVACGRFDGFWEMKLHPWDVCAAALIVREAGGRTSDFQEVDFMSTSPHVLASNGLIHVEMLDVLKLETSGRRASDEP